MAVAAAALRDALFRVIDQELRIKLESAKIEMWPEIISTLSESTLKSNEDAIRCLRACVDLAAAKTEIGLDTAGRKAFTVSIRLCVKRW